MGGTVVYLTTLTPMLTKTQAPYSSMPSIAYIEVKKSEHYLFFFFLACTPLITNPAMDTIIASVCKNNELTVTTTHR